MTRITDERLKELLAQYGRRECLSPKGEPHIELDDIASALDELLERRAGATWRPIETAPKDISWLMLGYFPEAGGQQWIVASWDKYRNLWITPHAVLNADGYFSPTHWMPLPAAPGAGAAAPIAKYPEELQHQADAELARPEAPAVPAGWVAMPTAPTEEIMRAMCDAFIPVNGDTRKAFAECYPRMLAASIAAPAVEAPPKMTDAARDVLAERKRQIEKEGWSPSHDDEHAGGGMAYAAAAYAVSSAGHTERSFFITSLWAWTGWASKWFKPKSPRADLIRSGALILAEVERIDRAATPKD